MSKKGKFKIKAKQFGKKFLNLMVLMVSEHLIQTTNVISRYVQMMFKNSDNDLNVCFVDLRCYGILKRKKTNR